MTGTRAERALDALNLFLSDVRYGLGAYLAVYLLERHAWDEAGIGVALSAGAMAGLLAQTPVGVLLDGLRGPVTAGGLLIPPAPGFWPVAKAQAASGAAAMSPPTVAVTTRDVIGPATFPPLSNVAIAAAGAALFWLAMPETRAAAPGRPAAFAAPPG